MTKKQELLTKLLEDLSRNYPQELYEFLYTHRPSMYWELVAIEEAIDRIFLNSENNLEEFKRFLRQYWNFHKKAIRDFKTAKAGCLNLVTARNPKGNE